MSEEIIEVEQEFIDLAKAEMEKDPSLRPCKMCFHYESCHASKGIQQYNYGGNCFVTNEQMLRAMLLKEKKRALEQRKKFNGKLDVMNIMVSGADLIRVDLLDTLEREYKRLEIKAKTDPETYKKSKKNLARLQKCYASMKVSMQNFESDFRQFVEYWNAQNFADENGIYSPEYDNHSYNVGYCTYLFFCMFEKLYKSPENAKLLIDFMNNMEGEDIYNESDLRRYLIRI